MVLTTKSHMSCPIQSIIMRINTRRGKIQRDPEYGIVITDYLQRGMTPEELSNVAFEVRGEVEKDEDRIAACEVTAEVSGTLTGARLRLRFKVTPKLTEPFAFTLAVEELTLEILSVGRV